MQKQNGHKASCLQEVWPFYSLTSVKDGILNEIIDFVNFYLRYLVNVSTKCIT